MSASFDKEKLRLIRGACGYMTDDNIIAQIFGVMSPVVAAERAKIAPPIHYASASTYRSAGISDATYHIDNDAREKQAKQGSHELLKLSIQYGINHDSDLGMGYEPFMARARELGLVPKNHGEPPEMLSLGSPVSTSGAST